MRDLDLARFTAAWQSAIDRHPMLRAVIEADGAQRILETVPPFVIPVADFSRATRAAGEAAAEATRTELSNQLHPADHWPLFDIRVTRLPDELARCTSSIDALILDGDSTNLLLQEVFDSYQGQPPTVIAPPGAPSFRDYVLAVREVDTAATAAESYWRERVATLPPPPALPLARRPGHARRASLLAAARADRGRRLGPAEAARGGPSG